MSSPAALPPVEFIDISRQTNCRGFRCSSREINNWFKRSALREHLEGGSRVTCAVESGKTSRPLGFYALATVAEEANMLPGKYRLFRSTDYFSALQLVWLATDHGFTRRGLGERMVGRAIRTFADVGPQIGLPHLIVVPDPEDHERLTKFYGKLGFTPYKGGEAMFLPLQSAVEAVRAIEAELAAAAIPIADPAPIVEE